MISNILELSILICYPTRLCKSRCMRIDVDFTINVWLNTSRCLIYIPILCTYFFIKISWVKRIVSGKSFRNSVLDNVDKKNQKLWLFEEDWNLFALQ